MSHLLLESDNDVEDVFHLGESEIPSESLEGLTDPTISFYAFMGLNVSQTLRFEGIIENHILQVLVDGGSTHNFIRERVAKFLGLPITHSPHFKVQVGNGQFLTCQGMCSNIRIGIENHSLITNLFIISLQGVDIILGVQRLQQLGPVTTDYNALTMAFVWQGIPVQFQGLRDHQSNFISPNQLHKLADNSGLSSCFMLLPSTTSTTTPQLDNNLYNQVDSTLQPILQQFTEKSEIEKLVQEMLDSGVIQPSTSPFSSPVLLVKKRDASWRFCVDYRGLNAITIKDKFPIPTVDELLDELHGATMFSKLEHVITKSEWLHLISIKLPFEHMMGILNFFQSIDDHVLHLTHVLQTLKTHSLYAKFSKCMFGQHSIEYLGHVISNNGVQPDHRKIDTMLTWPVPSTLKQLRGYATIAAPLTELLKKNGFSWCNEAQQDFDNLKKAMTKDQKSLSGLMDQVIPTPEQQHYLTKLLGYHYEITYKPGKENSAADAVSLLPLDAPDSLPVHCMAISIPQFYFLDILRKELEEDTEAKTVFEKLQQRPEDSLHWSTMEGLLYFKGKLYLPILKKVGLVAYKLKLPEGSQIHPVFHISVLKAFHGNRRSVEVPLELPLISIDNRPVIEPLAILNERRILCQGKWVKQWLVQWKQLPLEETSWEDADEFHLLFLALHLEDKWLLMGVAMIPL
ncbi:uncharacterized protein LOC143850523 [Tasmannia lanceolata]|uniref:uncharacterized protein LOC143850523 n=1 Tax=Tasmannia lanceolata TaxID=3420 RepID=UPI004063CB64